MLIFFDYLAKRYLLFLLLLLFALLSGDWVSADQNELVAKISELDVKQSIIVLRSKKMADITPHLPSFLSVIQ